MTDRRRKLLHDALTAAAAAESFVSGKTLAAYTADAMRRLAVERLLEILGEACSRLAKEDADFIADVPEARLAVGLRNRIIHGYDAVDHETVYRTVIDDLPALRVALQTRLNALQQDGLILAVMTGGCPHTAIREDASINLDAVERMCRRFPDLDLIFIESGGDNLAATFSPELSDLTIYVIDVVGFIERRGLLAT